MCLVLWQVSNHFRLLSWYSIMLFCGLWTGSIIIIYRRQSTRSLEDMPRWENRFITSISFASLAWGLGALWIMPANSTVHQLFIYFMLVGMTSGGAAGFSASARLVRILAILILVPTTIWFIFQNNPIHWAMSFSTVVYIGAIIRFSRTLENSLRRTFRLVVDLEIATEKAHILAHTDDLTNLNNRRQFTILAETALETAIRYENPLTLTLFDIDKFKTINDKWGHAAGDEVLCALADIIKQTSRTTDISGRLGGDEFVILMPETGMKEAKALIERMQKKIGELVMLTKGEEFNFTCSFGMAEHIIPNNSMDQMILLADEALYKSKNKGGDSVTEYNRILER